MGNSLSGQYTLNLVSNNILGDSKNIIEEIVVRTKQPLDHCTALRSCLEKACADECLFRFAIRRIEEFKEEHPQEFVAEPNKELQIEDIAFYFFCPFLFLFLFPILLLLLNLPKWGIVMIGIIPFLFFNISKVLLYLLFLVLLILLVMSVVTVVLLVGMLVDNSYRSSKNFKGLEALNQFRANGDPFRNAESLHRKGSDIVETQRCLLGKVRQINDEVRREGNRRNAAGTTALIAAVTYRALSTALRNMAPFLITVPWPSFDKSLKHYQRDWRRQEELLSNVENSICRAIDELNAINRSFISVLAFRSFFLLSFRHWPWCKSEIASAAGEEEFWFMFLELMSGSRQNDRQVFKELKDLSRQIDNFKQEYIEERAEILKMISIK